MKKDRLPPISKIYFFLVNRQNAGVIALDQKHYDRATVAVSQNLAPKIKIIIF